MNQLFEALKSARRIEILVILAMICVLIVLWMGGGGDVRQQDGEEARMERLLSSIEGAGRVSVMISRNAEGEIGGVVVAASGADDLRAMLELQQAVRTLTGLELDRIEIVKSKG